MTTREQYYELSFYTLTHQGGNFIHQHIVDAYAAKTADEDTKPIAVFFSLAGLYLFVKKNYTGRQVQDAHLQMAEKTKEYPKIILPKNRGKITVNGRPIELEKLSGKVQVVAMIFTSCGYACPKIVHNMKEIERQLPAHVRKESHFLLISFDTKTDTPERLKQYADQKMLGDDWTFLHGTPDEVRLMSMLLDVQYVPLQGGGFNHSNVITVLDENGNIYKRIEGLDINIHHAVADIETATQS